MMTPLDEAHGIMVRNQDQDAARLRFYERLVSVDLFLLLEAEPSDDKITPQVFPFEGGDCVLVFDSEARLAEFSGQTAAFVAMSGRAIIEMLMTGEADFGLGINLDVAPSSFLLPHDGVVWLSEMLGNTAMLMHGRVKGFSAPIDVGADFLSAISAKLTTATGLAESAILVGVSYEDGTKGNLLAFIGAVDAAQAALSQAVGEVVSFSARDEGIDIGFFAVGDPRINEIEKVGLGFDIAKISTTDAHVPGAGPGMDPDVPPNLR